MLTNPSFDKKNKSETGRHYFAESKSKNSSKEMLKKKIMDLDRLRWTVLVLHLSNN